MIDLNSCVEHFSLDEINSLLAEIETKQRQNKIATLFPGDGPFSRYLYPRHMEFFEAGYTFRQRCFMAGNRTGKTVAGAFETTHHLTGEYPDWWVGKRFEHPIDGWAAGDTSETTRDVIQHELLGKPGEFGTGMIPFDKLASEPSKRRGVADAVDTIRVKHVSGGVSTIGLKSYDQGRKKFQGTAKHIIWADEEPPEDVYDEMVMRTMTTNGIVLCTFTPLSGLTKVALRFLPHLAIKLEGAKIK